MGKAKTKKAAPAPVLDECKSPVEAADASNEQADESKALKAKAPKADKTHVILVRDEVDPATYERRPPPYRSHVHVDEVQGYIDANTGWHHEDDEA